MSNQKVSFPGAVLWGLILAVQFWHACAAGPVAAVTPSPTPAELENLSY